MSKPMPFIWLAPALTNASSAPPDMTITKSHSGNFTQGQTGATYTVTVTNSGSGPTTAAVSVSDTVPTGLTATSIAGTGWTCTQPSGPCNRSSVLNAGASYPALTLTVNVAASAPASVTNTATVSGGGETAPRPMFRMMAMAAPTPVAPGEQSVTADVTVVWEIH